MGGVGHFEVAVHTGRKVHRRASHARVLNVEGDPDRLDDVLEMIPAKLIPAVRAFAVSIGGFWLADREKGTAVRVTLFDSATSLADSRDHAEQLRAQSAAQMPGAFSEFAEYEVIALEEAPARPNDA
jgi:hypothetical protein